LLVLAVYAAAIAVGWRLTQQKDRVEWLEWRPDGCWYLKTIGAEKAVMAELSDFRLCGSLIRLDLHIGRRRRAITVWPDNADPDALRRLRIRLPREGIARAMSPSTGAVR
jgi:hypothetical protein